MAERSSLREQLQQVEGELKEAHSRNHEISTQLQRNQDEVCLLTCISLMYVLVKDVCTTTFKLSDYCVLY